MRAMAPKAFLTSYFCWTAPESSSPSLPADFGASAVGVAAGAAGAGAGAGAAAGATACTGAGCGRTAGQQRQLLCHQLHLLGDDLPA